MHGGGSGGSVWIVARMPHPGRERCCLCATAGHFHRDHGKLGGKYRKNSDLASAFFRHTACGTSLRSSELGNIGMRVNP